MSTCPFLSITKGFSSWGFTCNLKLLPGFLCSVSDLSKQQKSLPFETMANGVSLHPHRTAGSGFQQRELGKPSKYILLNLTLEIHPPWLTHYVQFTFYIHKAIRQTAWIPMLVIFYPILTRQGKRRTTLCKSRTTVFRMSLLSHHLPTFL